MIRTFFFVAMFASPAIATVTPDLAVKFGVREAFDGVALSPDGSRISYLNPIAGRGAALVVVDIASGAVKPAMATGDPARRISGCLWVKIDRLICRVREEAKRAGYVTAITSLVGVDASGANVRVLGRPQILDLLPDDPTRILVASGSVVQRMDVKSGIQSGPATKVPLNSFIFTDPDGAPRARGTYDVRETASESRTIGKRLKYSYRTRTGDGWLPLGTSDLTKSASLDVGGFDATGDWLYGLEPKNGRQALFRYATDGSNRKEAVLARPDVDVDGVSRIGKRQRPIGVLYTTDYQQIDYFDGELAALSARLQRELPGKPPVTVINESWDGSKLLIFAGSDADPGSYYLYDKAVKRLGKLSASRPDLEGLKLSAQAPIIYPARDGTKIPGFLTLPPSGTSKGLPLIMMPHGGPAARDARGFDWLSQYFAQLGYAVLQPNYRGSAGYGEAWIEQNGWKAWRSAMHDINDGARWAVAQGIADPKRLAIVGWSYGGYAALQANVIDPDLYKAIIAIAPVTDIELLRDQSRDYSDFHILSESLPIGPEALAASPDKHAAAIKAPVLMFHGSVDLNVDLDHSKAMAKALIAAGKQQQLIVYPGLSHSLVDSAVRADMLLKSARFLEANLK